MGGYTEAIMRNLVIYLWGLIYNFLVQGYDLLWRVPQFAHPLVFINAVASQEAFVIVQYCVFPAVDRMKFWIRIWRPVNHGIVWYRVKGWVEPICPNYAWNNGIIFHEVILFVKCLCWRLMQVLLACLLVAREIATTRKILEMQRIKGLLLNFFGKFFLFLLLLRIDFKCG